MRGRTWVHRCWLAEAAVSLSIAMVQPAAGEPVVKGDPAAWAEINAAMKKAFGLSHRERTTSGSTTTIMEWVPPDSRRIITHTPNGVAEAIVVGTAYRMRNGDKWLSLWGRADAGANGAIAQARGHARGGDRHARPGSCDRRQDDPRLQLYIHSAVSRAIHKQRWYIGIQTGLLRRIVFDKTGSTLDFYDYGAKITITLPPCS